MYATGIPVGMLVDSKGPRPAAFLGAVLLILGYYPLQKGLSPCPHLHERWLILQQLTTMVPAT